MMEVDSKTIVFVSNRDTRIKNPSPQGASWISQAEVLGERAYALAEAGLKKSFLSPGPPLHWTLSLGEVVNYLN